jgi:hypothetical protein
MCGYTWGGCRTQEEIVVCCDCRDFMEETPMHCYLCCRPICDSCAISAGDHTTDVICKPCRIKEQCSKPHTTIETPDALVTLYGGKTKAEAPILAGGQGHDAPSVLCAGQAAAVLCGAFIILSVGIALWLMFHVAK